MQGSRGLFITFEGIDGAGKSTQVKLLSDRLTKLSIPHTVTLEPGGTELGQQIRNILLHTTAQIEPLPELFLFLAARAQLVKTVIEPALARNEIVICDRFSDSSIAYQCYGRRLKISNVQRLNDEATGGRAPHATVWLDVTLNTSAARCKTKGTLDRFEGQGAQFHQLVIDGYVQQEFHNRGRIFRVLGDRSTDEVATMVWETLYNAIAPLVPESSRNEFETV